MIHENGLEMQKYETDGYSVRYNLMVSEPYHMHFMN